VVAAHVEASGLPADAVVAEIPPAWGRATVERIAANTVMAGCDPLAIRAVIAALRALLDDKVGLHGVQCTTHVASPLLVYHGPVRVLLGIESGHNCLGQGTRGNATIGRAVRLVLVNIGGARPGGMDKASFGHPGKLSYCFAENEGGVPVPAVLPGRRGRPLDRAPSRCSPRRGQSGTSRGSASGWLRARTTERRCARRPCVTGSTRSTVSVLLSVSPSRTGPVCSQPCQPTTVTISGTVRTAWESASPTECPP